MSIYGPDDLLEDPTEGTMEELKRYIDQRMPTYVERELDIRGQDQVDQLNIEDTVREYVDTLTREFLDEELTNVMPPKNPGDVASKAYVDDVIAQLPAPKEVYHFKLRCGPDQEVNTRDFAIPNEEQRFGLDTRCLFIQFSARQTFGEPTPCCLSGLTLDENNLTLRFGLSRPYPGKITLYATVQVLMQGELEQYVGTAQTGRLP